MSPPIVASEFLADVARAFATLIQRGLLTVASSVYDDHAFGNAAVVLEGGLLRVRLVRDRGQVIVEVACADRPEDWSSLQRVLRVLLGSSAPPEGVLTVDEAAKIVERHYQQLRDACSPANVVAIRAKLSELERQAMNAFIERGSRGTN